MLKRFFAPNYALSIRTENGVRQLQFSSFHKWLAIAVLGFGFVTICGLGTQAYYQYLIPSSNEELGVNLRQEYEARIDSLVAERNSLITSLEASKINESKLIDNLSRFQGMMFDLEREKYELSANITAMRSGLIEKQNKLDALDLTLEAQKEQLANAMNGEAVTGSTTLNTITQTLAETASSRDQAREQVQLLRDQILRAEADRDAKDKRRDILFSQIETAVEESLSPLQSTLKKTGLNVNSLLKDIRASYSGVGGIDVDASYDIFGQSGNDSQRIGKLISNLDKLSQYSYAIRSLPIANPVRSNYRMSSAFGYRIHPISRRRKLHTGQDMAGPVGTPIYAPGGGKVTYASRMGGYGNTIKIQHQHGIETLYAHLSKINVKVGQSVALGQQIGKMGSTGASTGSHLHYEIRVNGNHVNPMNFLRASNYVQ